MTAIDLVQTWPGTGRGLIVESASGPTQAIGEVGRVFQWASITKVAVGLATLCSVEEGLFALDDEVGPGGATVRQLLSHAGGIAPDSPEQIAVPGTRRIYSNAGFNLLGAHLERWTGLPLAVVLSDLVFEPLGMHATSLRGEAASGVTGPTADLTLLARELLGPTLLSRDLADELHAVQFPGIPGVLPGVGRFMDCTWGLGVEVKGPKEPHWTSAGEDALCFGHFGRAGGFLIVDPTRARTVVSLGDEMFGDWALTAWPKFFDLLDHE